MKKSVKILAGLTAFVLIGGILWFANGLLGNPISKAIANNTAKKYIEENYYDMNLEVSDAFYSFKSGSYYVDVKSPTSKDTYFSISISSLGKIEYDSYEDNVIKKFNTYIRLNELYDKKIQSVFDNNEFPYKSDISYGELREMPSKELDSEYTEFGPAYGLNLSELELDKDYNINKIGKKSGHIVFYAQDEDISIKRASEILFDIKNILDEKNVSFHAIDFTLEKPREGEQVNPEDKSISIEQFLYSDIYENGIENRMKKAIDNLQKHYEEQDKIKEKEMKSLKEEEK